MFALTKAIRGVAAIVNDLCTASRSFPDSSMTPEGREICMSIVQPVVRIVIFFSAAGI
ncbi:hypothetical protein [Rhodovulum strictum]|uniref:Uncharacterized protein n=1 Tax=Rhodovulum strictum TaxID=58314 RepID=A0A844BLA8_9RHOB|nr:hypothetical protein [Rhodovulum strictum]MRH21743.1 hypothetical protein [Rhodovulum strictum]